jgi:organic hydroperoxide reductase OsmC/OhrA
MIADAPIDMGGGGAGFGADELFEAALAVCINMASTHVRDRARDCAGAQSPRK